MNKRSASRNSGFVKGRRGGNVFRWFGQILPRQADRLIGVRLAILDMDLVGGGVAPKIEAATLAQVLRKDSLATERTYAIIAWTKHPRFEALRGISSRRRNPEAASSRRWEALAIMRRVRSVARESCAGLERALRPSISERRLHRRGHIEDR